jgi:hypothetical protein
VYGSIRSMSFASTSKKFDSAAYIERYAPDTPRPRSRASR